MNSIDEQQLLERIRQGDTSAFKRLHDDHYRFLYVLALKKLGDEDDAYDLLQEMFMELWERRETLFLTNPLQNYLKNRLWFKLAAFFRRKGFREKHLQAFTVYVREAPLEDGLFEIEQREMALQYDLLFSKLDAAVAQMPNRMREAFNLSRSGKYSTSEVAAKMGISKRTVENQLALAIQRIKRALADQEISVMGVLFLIWITKN